MSVKLARAAQGGHKERAYSEARRSASSMKSEVW